MKNLFDINVGKRIKDARKKSKLTIEDVQNLTGISRQSLINYENGKGNPTLKNIVDLCNLFKISPNYLIYGDDNNFNNMTSSLKKKVYSLVALDSDNDISYDSINGIIRFKNNTLKKYFSYCHAMLSRDDEFSKLEIIDMILQYLDEELEKEDWYYEWIRLC